jgi:hypothetical protein
VSLARYREQSPALDVSDGLDFIGAGHIKFCCDLDNITRRRVEFRFENKRLQ